MIKEDFSPMGLWIVDVTADHLALLSSAAIHKTQGEYSPFIGFGGYRPFGNSDHYGDIADALGIDTAPAGDMEPGCPAGFQEKADKLYDELDGVLMVILKRRSFKLGRYYSFDMGDSWASEAELKEAGIGIRELGDRPKAIEQFASEIAFNTTSVTARLLVERIECIRALLVKSHEQMLRLLTAFVSDQDGAYRQTCDLMREIREA